MIEEWKEVQGFEGCYFVSNFGRVRSLKRRKKQGGYIMSHAKLMNGYLAVGLFKEGKCSRRLVHRLVVEAFIDKIPSEMVVNHIDNNPSNNVISNLEIVTQSQNLKHAFNQGRINPPQKGKFGGDHNAAKKISAYKSGELIGTWNSVKELKSALGIRSNNIAEIVKGGRMHLCGYTFKYR